MYFLAVKYFSSSNVEIDLPRISINSIFTFEFVFKIKDILTKSCAGFGNTESVFSTLISETLTSTVGVGVVDVVIAGLILAESRRKSNPE